MMSACEQSSQESCRSSAVRIAVVQGALPDDWRTIHERLNRRANRFTGFLLKSFACSATFGGVLVAGGLLAVAIAHYFPGMSPYSLSCAVILPALLAGAAAGQWSGNLFLRFYLRLDDATRRGFATRLSLARCPAEWPAYMKRWLFTGDWLSAPGYDLRLPYVRMYVRGDAPLTCREEDALWREIHGNISGDSLWEAGTNIREISYPDELPSWAKKVENGDGFTDLGERIGQAEASEWVMHLWRRASRQWPALGANDYPEKARRECFEMHSLTLADGREALIVVLRPVSFVLEMDAGTADRHEAAA